MAYPSYVARLLKRGEATLSFEPNGDEIEMGLNYKLKSIYEWDYCQIIF